MTKSVLIVGCGVFGLSTALELAQKGYSVIAIDLYEPPSQWSAACDYNKIIRAEYPDMAYTILTVEAIEQWRNDPKFKGIYNECGRVMVTPSANVGRQNFEKIGIENLQKLGKAENVEYFKGGSTLSKRFNFLKFNGLKKTETAKFNPYSGLAHSSNAMVAVYKEAKNLGVKFIFGDDGHANKLKKIGSKTYVETKGGLELTGDQVIVALGANTNSLVDLQDQQAATGLFVTFIQLTNKEYELYKDCSILFDAEMGYFFPPDPETKLLKVALPGCGVSNFVSNPHSKDKKISLPRFHNLNPTDTIPVTGELEAKLLLAKYIPELAYHELIGSKICWVGDTQGSHFIIDKVPHHNNLYVASGDSGHGFKFLPNIGKYIVQKLENKLDPQLAEFWKWKEGLSFDPAECDWRVSDEYLDLSQIEFLKEKMVAKL